MRSVFVIVFSLVALFAVARCDISATVSWAHSYCNRNPEWLCAEFTARTLAAGGFIPLDPFAHTSQYASYRGYNLRMVRGLHDYLVSVGWREVDNTPSNIKAGYPIFGDAGIGTWSHACIGVGDGRLNCHNNPACNKEARYMFRSANSILAPPGGVPPPSAPVPAPNPPPHNPPPPNPPPPSGNVQCVTAYDGLRFRNCAGTWCGIISTLSYGQSVTILGPQQNAAGYLWKQVRYGSSVGWVASNYLGACRSSHLAADESVDSSASTSNTNSGSSDDTPAWVVIVCLLVGIAFGAAVTAGVMYFIVLPRIAIMRRSGADHQAMIQS